MKTFQEMGLPMPLMHALQRMKFNEPTPIQMDAIPLALQGKDILGSAQTGTGKTGAFGIPLVARLLSNPSSAALVMTPTRELATQVMSQLRAMLGKKSGIKSSLLIGGESMPKQLAQLRHHPQVIVGTPGRINDHLRRGSLTLRDTDFLVLDETDRMLDMGLCHTDQECHKAHAPQAPDAAVLGNHPAEHRQDRKSISPQAGSHCRQRPLHACHQHQAGHGAHQRGR